MSFRDAIDEAIDRRPDGGRVGVNAGEASAEVDVVRAGPIGVRVRGVRIDRGRDVDIAEEANALPDRLRGLPERVRATEVDPRLGGAVLRSRPDEMSEGPNPEFYQVDLHGKREAEVRRLRAVDGGGYAPVEFDLTRRQLGDLLDQLS